MDSSRKIIEQVHGYLGIRGDPGVVRELAPAHLHVVCIVPAMSYSQTGPEGQPLFQGEARFRQTAVGATREGPTTWGGGGAGTHFFKNKKWQSVNGTSLSSAVRPDQIFGLLGGRWVGYPPHSA